MAETRPAPRPVPGFPELADAAATWTALPGPGPEQEMRHLAGSWQPIVPCDNRACRGGGFDLSSVVERMVSFQETERVGILVCSGWEGEAGTDPGGGIPCVRTIRYRVTLSYRTSAAKVPGAPPGEPPMARGGPRAERP